MFHKVHNIFGTKKKDNLSLSCLRQKNKILFIFFATFCIGVIFLTLVYVFPKIWWLDFKIANAIEFIAKPANLWPALPSGPVDMLLVGIGGDENDAPYLTDTLIYSHYDIDENRVSMLSIPRDLFVDSSYVGITKINAVYAKLRNKLGHEKAMAHLLEIVSDITGKNVSYYVQGDFQGFRKIVDYLGWVEIDIPERIYDTNFPNATWGYTTLAIEPWLQTLDGELALAYARTRKTTSDFDRSQRQQLLLGAIRDGLYDKNILLSPKKIEELWVLFQENITTNFSLAQILQLSASSHDLDSENDIYSFGLNDSCELPLELCKVGWFLYTPNRDFFDDQSWFLPNGWDLYNVGNYLDIRKFTYLITNYPEFFVQSREMHIFNATWIPGIAGKYALYLKSFGFHIPSLEVIGNAEVIDSTKTFVYYDKTLPEEDQTVSALRFFLWENSVLPKQLPEFATVWESAIELILGQNYSTIFD